MPKRDLAAEMSAYEGKAGHKNEGAYGLQNPFSKLGCAGKTFKYFLAGLNLLFIVLCFIGLGIGAYALNSEISELVSVWFSAGVIVCAFVILIALIGLIGALKEWRPVLYVYAFTLSVLTIVALILAIYAISQKGAEEHIITPAWKSATDNTRSNLQTTFECCGLWTPTDLAVKPCPVADSVPEACIASECKGYFQGNTTSPSTTCPSTCTQTNATATKNETCVATETDDACDREFKKGDKDTCKCQYRPERSTPTKIPCGPLLKEGFAAAFEPVTTSAMILSGILFVGAVTSMCLVRMISKSFQDEL